MANACHLHFGKYTLFLCYRISANANASPFAFAIMLGNEIMSSWHQFWNYALKLHPYLDSTDVTIITDQDKGQKNTIAQHLRSTIADMLGNKLVSSKLVKSIIINNGSLV